MSTADVFVVLAAGTAGVVVGATAEDEAEALKRIFASVNVLLDEIGGLEGIMEEFRRVGLTPAAQDEAAVVVECQQVRLVFHDQAVRVANCAQTGSAGSHGSAEPPPLLLATSRATTHSVCQGNRRHMADDEGYGPMKLVHDNPRCFKTQGV